MSMHIRILPGEPQREVSVWEGKERERFEQWAVIELDGRPFSFIVSHPTKEQCHKPGEYELDPKSIGIERNRLVITRVVLRPASVAQVEAIKSAAKG